jgi:hypothetical protein
MGEDLDALKYIMAAEKMTNMIFVMEQTLEFLEEYAIKPDLQVKNALTPIIDELRNWLRDEK